jgi:hypothetical protein
MIITAYMDESGTHKAAPMLIVAGYVARLGQWIRFNKKWAKLLRDNGLTYHHTVEMMNRRGSYARWHERHGSRFIERATRIAEHDTLFGFVVRLNKSDYDKFYVAGERPRKIPLDTKYGVCFRVLLSFLPLILQRSISLDNAEVHLVLEAGATGIGDTKRIFDIFRKHAPPEISRLIPTRTEADKKRFHGLQAADTLAYAAYQIGEKEHEVYDFNNFSYYR